MVERVNHKMAPSKSMQSSSCSLPSLYKYMRRRRIMSRTGFYLEIKSSGEITCTRNPSSIYSVLLFLSVGPNFVAIVGEESKRYLAIDDRGKLFTSPEERKECVFREFLGRNFFSLLRTCYSDNHGRGWYLSINHCGKIRTEKVPYSDEPQLHLIIKVIDGEEKEQDKKQDGDQVWQYRENYRRSTSSTSSRSSRNSSPASTSSRSEYGSPLSFYHDQPDFRSPISFNSDRSAFASPVSFQSSRSAFGRPASYHERSHYGTPISFMGNSVTGSPSSPTGRSSPLSFTSARSNFGSPVTFQGRSPFGSPVFFQGRSDLGSPVSMSGISEYGTPLSFMYEPGQNSPVTDHPSRPVTDHPSRPVTDHPSRPVTDHPSRPTADSPPRTPRSRSSSSDRDSISSVGKSTTC